MCDLIKCVICGKEGKILKQHLREVHHMTKEEYQSKYPGSPVVLPSYHEKCQNRMSERNRENWKDPEYRERTSKMLREREITWSNSQYWKDHPDEIKRIASIGGSATMKLYGQSRLTQGKRDSDKYSKVKSEMMSKLAYKLHHDPKYVDVKKIIEGPKYGNLISYTLEDSSVVKLRSSFELKAYQMLVSEKFNFRYEPNDPTFKYEQDGKMHTYYPDFYLPDYHLIIECKPKCYTKWLKYNLKRQSVLDAGYNFEVFTEYEIDDPNIMKSLILRNLKK